MKEEYEDFFEMFLDLIHCPAAEKQEPEEIQKDTQGRDIYVRNQAKKRPRRVRG